MSKAFWTGFLLILPVLLFAEVPLDLELSQNVQSGWSGNSITGNPLTEDGYAAYVLTAFSASLSLEYGMVALAPSLGGEYSLGFSSLETGGYNLVGTPALFTGLTLEVAVSEEAVPYLGLELNVGAPVETEGNETALMDLVFIPSVGVAGELGGFTYDFSEAFELALDTSKGDEDNQQDDLALDIVGNYVLGYRSGIYSIELSDELSFGIGVLSAEEDPVVANDARLTFQVDLGQVIPSFGGLYAIETVDGETSYSIVGGAVGIGFAKENISANFGYVAGKDIKNDVLISLVSMSVGMTF